MPTYEYRCKDCGEHLEVVQAFTDDALTECPACKGQLRKVFGKAEMDKDLEFVRAKVGDQGDDIEYFSILPTSPP